MKIFTLKQIRLWHSLCLVLVLGIIACTAQQKSQEPIQPPSEVEPKIKVTPPKDVADPFVIETKSEKIKKDYLQIGVLLPLSGSRSQLAQQLWQGIEMAVFRHGNDNLKVRAYDTQGRAFSAEKITNKAIQDGADILLGPLFSHTSRRAFEVAKKANIPLFSFSNNTQILDTHNTSSSTVFAFGISPNEELRSLVKLSKVLGKEKLGLIAPNDTYGKQIYNDLLQQTQLGNLRLSKHALYDPQKIDFSEAIQNISHFKMRKRAYQNEVQRLLDSGKSTNEIERLMNYRETFGPPPFDALIIVAYSDNALRTLAAQLEYYDVEHNDVTFLGLRQWQGFQNLHQEPSLNGAFYVGLDLEPFQQFRKSYQEIYQQKPTILSALSFDLTSLITYFDRQKLPILQSILEETSGFKGSLGKFTIMPSGKVERDLTLYQILPSGIVPFTLPVTPENTDLERLNMYNTNY